MKVAHFGINMSSVNKTTDGWKVQLKINVFKVKDKIKKHK